jgi:spore coat polysaccharide biosynthesis predicted glycosyltransferase SpsG
MEAELVSLLPYLKERVVRGILIDSYFVTEHYLRELSIYYTITYMDDRNYVPYPVQNVINYNIYGEETAYKQIGNHSNIRTKYLIGCSYVPLRTEFQEVSYRVNEKILSVLITTGGSDKYNIAGKLIDAVKKAGLTINLEIHVVSGVFNYNLPYLIEEARTDPKIHIHQNVTNMSMLMQQCDVAIAAGGSTMYELCAVGVPSICFSLAENQKLMVEYFKMNGLALYAGDYQEVKDELIGEITRLLNYLNENVEDRRALSNSVRQLVDGYGTERIAEYLIND